MGKRHRSRCGVCHLGGVMFPEGYYLEIWFGKKEEGQEIVLSQYFGDNLESAIRHANKLAGCMLTGKGGSIVVSKKTQDKMGFIITEELVEL